MPTTLPALARHIAAQALRVSDGEYLRRFVEDRDEGAFAELVRRNGPLVLRACRSVLRDPAAAEDAFQTAFLQLARHAAELTGFASTAGWLHTAAVRAAGAIRRAEARRRRREQACPSTDTQPPADLGWLEVREAIDTELARLPEKYRLPLLVCYFEGLTYSAAAARIGCSLGALRGRLERGRQLLRSRLERRGLPAVALALGVGACPVVAADLRERILAAVRTSLAQPNVPVSWIALRPRQTLLVGCAVVLVAVGVGFGAFHESTDTPKCTPPAPPAVAAAGTAVPLDAFGDPLPPGAIARLGTRRFVDYSRDLAPSPDGKSIAVSDPSGRGLTLLDAVTGRVLRHQASVGVGGHSTVPATEGGVPTPGIFWKPDGHGVALVGRDPGDKYLWDFTDPKDVPPTFEPQPTDIPPPTTAEGAVSCAAVSPDGKWIAVARQSSDPARLVVQVFPCDTGRHLRDLKPARTLGPFPVASERIWFAVDGRELILARTDRTVVVIDATNGKELHRATLPKWGAIAASPDGKSVAIVPRDPKDSSWRIGEETVRVWDLTTGTEAWKFPRPGATISGVAFTPDGKHLVTSDKEFEFRKWDLATGREVTPRQPRNGHTTSTSVVAVSADGTRYATARSPYAEARTPSAIKVWDAATGTHVNPLPAHPDAVAGVAVSPDSRLVATVGGDGTLRVWQMNGKPVCTAAAPRIDPKKAEGETRRTVAFAPDGRGVLFDAAGVLVMADPTTGKVLDLPGGLKGQTGTVGGFSADGKTLVTCSGDATTLWNWPSGTARQTFRVALGERLIQPLRRETRLAPVAVGAVLSPDGGTLFTVSEQRSAPDDRWRGPNGIDCWDVKTGKHRPQFAAGLWDAHLTFSPDGRTLFAGGQLSGPDGRCERPRRDALASWDVATGTILRRFDDPLFDEKIASGLEAHARQVEAMTLSPDGRLLAVAEVNGRGSARVGERSVWIHETVTGRVLRRFDGHGDFVYDLAFTPDGSRLISVSHDHTGLIWDVTPSAFTDRKAGPLAPKELADAWDRLTAPDPVRGWRAVGDLVGSPAEAVAFLGDRLKSPVPTAADLDRIEKQLDAVAFADREKASAELDAFGPNAVAAVKARLKTTESPEAAKRFTDFLKRHAGGASPIVLRETRGVTILEAIGTPEARKVLGRLAGSRPGDHLAVEAAAALARLEKLGSRK